MKTIDYIYSHYILLSPPDCIFSFRERSRTTDVLWGTIYISFWKKKISCEVGRMKDLAHKGREEEDILDPDKDTFDLSPSRFDLLLMSHSSLWLCHWRTLRLRRNGCSEGHYCVEVPRGRSFKNSLLLYRQPVSPNSP